MTSVLSKGTLLTFIVLCLRLGSQAATLVLATRLLGPNTYGIYTAAASLAVVLGILPNLGAGYVMLANSSEGKETSADVWSYAWPASLVAGLLLLAFYVPSAHLINTTGNLSISGLVVMGATELLIMPIIYLSSFALQAKGRVPLGQFIQWLPLGLRALAAPPCFLLPEPQRLSAFVQGQALMSLIALTIALLVTQQCAPPNWRPRRMTPAQAKKGAPYALMHFVAMNPSELDKILAARLAGPGEAGIYSSANRVMSALLTPVVAMLLATQPRLFQHANFPQRETRRLIGNLAVIAFAWGICSSILLMLACPLLPLLFGEAFGPMVKLVPLLALVCPLLASRMSASSILVALGTPGQRVALELAGIAVLSAGILLLTPSFGLKGLILAVILSESLMLACGWFSIVRCLFFGHGTEWIAPPG